eukprot:TRINITY_DN711_c0_g1_i2.p1 TRINITY_DN711_c0_g1~~TRINITY_DN711_c0_g1_i2.p1  ORF type:complete len:395 (-),score=174.59 TRINITY_DN711_c0_g1_i2:262-1446(-)
MATSLAKEKGTPERPYKVVILTGDGAGPAVTDVAVSVLESVGSFADIHFDFERLPYGTPDDNTVVAADTIAACERADAVLRGPQGKTRADSAHESLRVGLGLFAQLRPVTVNEQLVAQSPLRPDIVTGTDLLVVREVSGGALPYTIGAEGDDDESASSVMSYDTAAVERIAKVALSAAGLRSGRVVNVDKADVMNVSAFWRRKLHAYFAKAAKNRPEISLDNMFVDDFCREVVLRPRAFDVVVTSNLFGDLLCETVAALSGPQRLSPSAWFGDNVAVFGPADVYNLSAYPESTMGKTVRNSSPVANPVSTIRASAMMLRYALAEPAAANLIQQALARTMDAASTLDAPAYAGMQEMLAGNAPLVDAAGFGDAMLSSLDFMKQYEFVCAPEECGE